MLPKKNRFKRDSFPTQRPEKRKNFSWGAVSVYAGTKKAAVVVGKKVLSKAHDRNRLKRRVYAALEHLPDGVSVVVYPRKEALTLPVDRLSTDIQAALL